MGLDNPSHLILIAVILLLLFGARRLPEIGRSLGQGMREFKQSVSGESHSQGQQPTLTAGAAAPAPPPQPTQAQPAQAPAAPQHDAPVSDQH